MRIVSNLVVALTVLTANAQTDSTSPALETQLTTHISPRDFLTSTETERNEIVSGQVTYSGIAVELVSIRNPLQLVNPAAPAKYGSGEDNVLWDSTSGRVFGWKIFSIGF